MRFRTYENESATLKEWSKQLNVANKGTYQLYPSVDNTLNHWKNELNKTLETNTFSILSSSQATLNNWKDKLNGIYNI